MRIRDLIQGDFSFNFPFRILEYIGDVDNPDETILIYESNSVRELPNVVLNRWISAINTGDDGVMEIEYTPLIGEE